MFQSELEHRIQADNIRRNIVRRHRRRHNRYQQSHRKSFVNFLQSKHHSRQGCMKGCCQTSAGPACHNVLFLGLPPVQQTGNSLACHGAQLNGRALSPQRQTAQQAQKPSCKFGRKHLFPVLTQLPQNLSFHLGNAASRNHGLPLYQFSRKKSKQKKHQKPARCL